MVNDEEVAKLLKLNIKIKDLSRPLMTEYMFYGFEDLTDDYDYGREVYKEDIYETHSNMSFNYIRENLYYLPWALSSEEKAEDMGGYMKYGRKCKNIIKYNVKITVVKVNFCFYKRTIMMDRLILRFQERQMKQLLKKKKFLRPKKEKKKLTWQKLLRR